MKLNIKIILLRSLWIGLCVIAIGLIFNWLSTSGIPLVADHQTIMIQGQRQKIPIFRQRRDSSKADDTMTQSPIREANTEKVRQIFAQGGAIFIDTRAFEEYLAGHIVGAVAIPYEEFQSDLMMISELDRTVLLVTYCDGSDCQSSIDLAVRLNELGFNNVWFYFGGWKEWLAEGLPIVKGSKP